MQPNIKPAPTESLARIVFVIYVLHLFSAINGLLSPAFIVTAFLTGWPSIVALIMSYIWRDDARGSYLYSHFDWVIKTFWVALIGFAIAGALIFTILLSIIGIPIMLIVGIWVLYRLVKGILALNKREAI